MALSTHPGGAANKAGHYHEALWGVDAFLAVLYGEASEIRVETPGDDGAEFHLVRGNVREHWQAKRQVTRQDTWTIRALGVVLTFFSEKFRAGDRCGRRLLGVPFGAIERPDEFVLETRDLEGIRRVLVLPRESSELLSGPFASSVQRFAERDDLELFLRRQGPDFPDDFGGAHAGTVCSAGGNVKDGSHRNSQEPGGLPGVSGLAGGLES